MFTGGIIAAGHGSRFREQGFSCPKPLLKVNGKELLGRTVLEFKRAGIKRIRVIFRRSICESCSNYLTDNFPDMEFEIICKDTNSSAESFLTILKQADLHERMLITTVDSIYRPGALKTFVEKAKTPPPDSVTLGISGYVDDEKPLFVKLDHEDREKITSIGGAKGDAVTCGVYLLPGMAKEIDGNENFPALRAFLSKLFSSGLEFRAVDMGKVIDVDRPQDMKKAEAFVRSFPESGP